MPTRRKFTLMTFVALTAGALVVLAQPAKQFLGSTAFDWKSMEAKPTATGFSRKVFESPTATLDMLECHITTLNPGQASHPPHRHPHEEMFIVKEGILDALVDGNWKRLGPGSVVFEASNTLHGVRNTGDTPVTYHVISWHTPATPRNP